MKYKKDSLGDRMKTYENKFGMFVHWGIYAMTELQDQAIIRYSMNVEEYENN